jgi:hypothetical protein
MFQCYTKFVPGESLIRVKFLALALLIFTSHRRTGNDGKKQRRIHPMPVFANSPTIIMTAANGRGVAMVFSGVRHFRH